MAAIGVPLSRAVFGDRPRSVWPFYAPAIGIVVVLLTTNLSAYVIPGAPSAWFGLLAPSALAMAVAWRGRQIRRPSRRAALASLALLLVSAGIYVLAFANRTQTHSLDEPWHYALALRLARGVFPPVTPYGVDAGIGYHYGPVLLAASIVNAAAVPVWTAMVVLVSFLVVALILVGIGFARDMGGSLPLSIGAGAVLGLSRGALHVGLPPYIQASDQSTGLAAFLEGLAPAEASVAFRYLLVPQFALALTIVILTGAALHSRATSRTAAMLVAAAGVSALAEASVFIFSSAALGLVGLLRLARLRGREQCVLAAALLAAGLLAALAGGPVSDALFVRGGTADAARIALEPDWDQLAPFDLDEGPALLRIGILPLLAVLPIAAYRRRSWGLWYLTAAGCFGVVASAFVHSPIPENDWRILNLATVTTAFAALAAVAGVSGSLRGLWRIVATLAVILFVFLPLVVPRATVGVRLASQGFGVRDLNPDGSGYPFVGQTSARRDLFRKSLEGNWDFYSWLSSSLPNDARLLTTHPASIASTTGVATPTSGLSLQVLSGIATPVYEDAIRFLHRGDLAEMGITHLHVTDAWQQVLGPEAQSLLDNPGHFRILAEIRSISGQRHRLFAVVPGAGTVQVNPESLRKLRQLASLSQPFIIPNGLTVFQRQMLLYTFVNHEDVRAPWTWVDRGTRIPRFKPVTEIPRRGTVALPDRIEPLVLGLSAGDAIWTGYGMRVYDLALTWSPVWRVGADFPSPGEQSQRSCESGSNRELNLRLLGEPGNEVLLGHRSVILNGKPQASNIPVGICRTLRLATESGMSPFAQVRARQPDSSAKSVPVDSALGFDGGYEADKTIINLWYRNVDQIPHSAGTELRLYEVGPMGIAPGSPNSLDSQRWWPGPIALAPDTQMARIEFDPKRLQVNRDFGGGVANDIVIGRTYILTLNVADLAHSGLAEIRQQVPIIRFKAGDEGILPQVFSGIVNIRLPVQASARTQVHTSYIGVEIDRTPG